LLILKTISNLNDNFVTMMEKNKENTKALIKAIENMEKSKKSSEQ
jgi:uncharacterized protein Yka (UPF0111/DUF47 family)